MEGRSQEGRKDGWKEVEREGGREAGTTALQHTLAEATDVGTSH